MAKDKVPFRGDGAGVVIKRAKPAIDAPKGRFKRAIRSLVNKSAPPTKKEQGV